MPTNVVVYVGIWYWEAFEDYADSGCIPSDLRARFFDWLTALSDDRRRETRAR